MENLKRRIHDFEKSHGRQLDLRRKFNNVLRGGSVDVPTIDIKDFWVGIEIETCCNTHPLREEAEEANRDILNDVFKNMVDLTDDDDDDMEDVYGDMWNENFQYELDTNVLHPLETYKELVRESSKNEDYTIKDTITYGKKEFLEERNKYLVHFDKTEDGSIRCKKHYNQDHERSAAEYVLGYDDRQYFQKRESIKADMCAIMSSCVPCADNDKGESTCGLHIHLSHPSIKKEKYPGFDKYFSRYWTTVLHKQLTKNHDFKLRKKNQFCIENVCYYMDRNEKYRQLNFLPSQDSDLWHFEFRGLGDGVKEGEKEIDRYIEALARGYRQAFLDFVVNKPISVEKNYWMDTIDNVIYTESEDEKDEMLSNVADILDEAADAGTPVDLTYSGADNDMTMLIQILFHCKMDTDPNSTSFAVPFLKRILNHVKDWQAHIQYHETDEEWYTPLSWITWHDNSKSYPISIPLVPYLVERGYPLPAVERTRVPDDVLEAWDAIAPPQTKKYWFKGLFELLEKSKPLNDIIELLDSAAKQGHPISMEERLPGKEFSIFVYITAYATYSKNTEKNIEQLKNIIRRVENWGRHGSVENLFGSSHSLDEYYEDYSDDEYDEPEKVSPLYWIKYSNGVEYSKIYEGLLPLLRQTGYFEEFNAKDDQL